MNSFYKLAAIRKNYVFKKKKDLTNYSVIYLYNLFNKLNMRDKCCFPVPTSNYSVIYLYNLFNILNVKDKCCFPVPTSNLNKLYVKLKSDIFSIIKLLFDNQSRRAIEKNKKCFQLLVRKIEARGATRSQSCTCIFD